jgi:anti-sigma regulatory factor (Ser/Thr protein kinase)
LAVAADDRVEVALRVAPEPSAPLRARVEVDALELPTPACDDVTLLVSELVTNSVVHADLDAGQDIDLRISRSPRIVRVEVCDDGPGFAGAPLEGGSTAGHGFGLYLVEQLADRWGINRDTQTCVWFELDLPRA